MDQRPYLKVVRSRAESVGDDQFTHEERQIRDLVGHAGWAVIQKIVAEQERRLLTEIIPRGAGDGVPSHAQYIRVTAKIDGLREFAQIAETVFAEAERRREIASEASAGAGGRE